MGQREIIHIADGGGWYLVHEGRKIGPYPSEAEAVSVARNWAELAKRKGYEVEIVVDGDGDISGRQQGPNGGQDR